MRTVILVLALFFIALLAFLTLYVLFTSGPDVLVVLSLLVLGLFAVGVIGALFDPAARMIRRVVLVVLIVAAGAAGAGLLAHRSATGDAEAANPEALTAGFGGLGTAPSALAVRLDVPRDPVHVAFQHPPASALLFNVDTGEVLWRRRATTVRPIASLTKMMTALLVVDNVPPWGRVRITPEAVHFKGSGVGMLPRGRLIRVETMLHGLLLVSGNDAAIALAQRVGGGSQRAFVRLMNERAQAMGLACTRYSTPSGIRDAGNHSCAGDLAALARAVLRQPRLARIVRERFAALPFPTKGGKLYLYNTNPLLREGYRGTTGVKTGYTDAAGRCLVATARRGATRLGVVLLDSPDPGRQAERLLDLGFAANR